MAYLTAQTSEAFDIASHALRSGTLTAATEKESQVYASEAIVMAIKGLCFEIAALREAVEDRAETLEHGVAE